MTNWPLPTPSVPAEPKPIDVGSQVGEMMTLGDGSVWRWTGEDWERLPWTDAHEVRRVHRVLPALDTAVQVCQTAEEEGRPVSDDELVRVVDAAEGDDIALIEASAMWALHALRRDGSGEDAARLLAAASARARAPAP